jgi:hypothetical protein
MPNQDSKCSAQYEILGSNGEHIKIALFWDKPLVIYCTSNDA